MLNSKITIFKNILELDPNYITVSQALDRIKNGKSKQKVIAIRQSKSKDETQKLKKDLPSVCFSGVFPKGRKDAEIQEHSGFMVLDFDDVENVYEYKTKLFELDYVFATWVSPSGNGVKALVRIADGKKHREHFEALRDLIPEIDRSGINVSRVCYESFDEDIFIKETCEPFTKYKIVETYKEQKRQPTNNDTFEKILKWLTGRGDAFRTGSRNMFVFKLASACCRFGLSENECTTNIIFSFLNGSSDFTTKECEQTVASAYRCNSASYGTAFFSNDILVTKGTTKEVEIDESIYDLEVKPKDVFFGEDVKMDAVDIYLNGYKSATSTYMGRIDYHFKWKRGEITAESGIGNYGKSTILKYKLLLKVVNEGSKIALFVPEDFPAHEFYHSLVEMYCGCECVPSNPYRPSQAFYEAVYDFISKHFFFVYPKTVSPTPQYIKERFLELIIKMGVSFCVIDPFNQMSNNYASVGGKIDQYLELTLAEFGQFARDNDIHFIIVLHPNADALKKLPDGNYAMPHVGNFAGGAMWNNKMDNIFVYHRPLRESEPDNPICELKYIKIKRQNIVGKPGTITFEMSNRTRRFLIDGEDYLQISIDRVTEEQNLTIQEEVIKMSKYEELPEKTISVLDLVAMNRQAKEPMNEDEVPF